jgi:hypothetical protein
MATGTRTTPNRKATSTNQNVQRQRRTTPTPSSAINPEIAARKPISAVRRSPVGSRSAWS